MEEENPLLSNPFFSSPMLSQPTEEQAREALADRLGMVAKDLPPPPTVKETAIDVAKSIPSGAARGFVGTMKGGVGSLESFGKDLIELGRQGYLAGQEKLDVISPAEYRESSAQPLFTGLTPEQQAGRVAPFSGLPTYKGVTEDFKQSAEARSLPFTTYEPQTGPGKVASTAAEYAMQGIPGGLRGAAGRMVTGAGAGAGTGLAEISATDPEDNTFRTVLYSLGGAGLAAGGHSLASKITGLVKTAVAPGGAAERELAAMIAQDIRRGSGSMNVEQFNEAVARGVPVTITDLASPETLKRLSTLTTKTPTLERMAGDYNEFIVQRAQQSGNRIAQNVDDVFGRPVNAPLSTEMADRVGKQQRDEVYGLVRDPSNAAAHSVDQSLFNDLFKRPIFKQAMKDAEIRAQNMPEYEMRPPQRVGGTPPQGTGQFDEFGEEIMRPGTGGRLQPGNLSYWDQVKRELDGYITRAENKINPDPQAAAQAISARNELLRTLDEIPGYKNARGVAAETFGARDAPEAGAKFFDRMDMFRRQDATNAFNSMSDAQKELFREGFASRITEIAREGNIGSLAERFTKPAFRDRALMVLGPERYYQINAAVASENLISKAKQLGFVQQPQGVKEASLKGAGLAAATDMFVFGNQMGSSPEQIAKLIGAAVASAAGKVGLNAIERRIATNIIPLATSQKPEDIQKLAKLIQASPATNQVLGKLSTSLTTAITAAQDRQAEGERAFGGRAGRATGGRVGVDVEADALVRAADRAKKSFNKTTEPLLNAPDNHIAKALEVANRAI